MNTEQHNTTDTISSTHSAEICCGEFKTCNKPCCVRADYWKENSRVEINQLALSILAESLRNDEGYYISWKSNIAMSFFDKLSHIIDNRVLHRLSNEAAEEFLHRLFFIDNKNDN